MLAGEHPTRPAIDRDCLVGLELSVVEQPLPAIKGAEPWASNDPSLWLSMMMRRSAGRSTSHKDIGLAVETFASADDFLASGRIAATACLVLDVHMPGLSGLELQSRLICSEHHIPIIFISAFADEAARALAAGACRYLVKPFEEDDLLDGIR
jgi:CheY-like chemotaxis protein